MFNNINLTLDLRINNIEYLQVIETLYLSVSVYKSILTIIYFQSRF